MAPIQISFFKENSPVSAFAGTRAEAAGKLDWAWLPLERSIADRRSSGKEANVGNSFPVSKPYLRMGRPQ